MPPVRWLRVSYWTGAVTDALAGIAMLVPQVGRSVYGMSDFSPGADYHYAMGLGTSLMFGWSGLLLWADRKPLERRGVLILTVFPVIFGLALAGGYAVLVGLIPFENMMPTWVLQAGLSALFVFSYLRSGSSHSPLRQ
jgi:hypothetical protein